MEIYEVGGAVRDRLLGRPVADRDWVVVGGTRDDMLARGFRQVGNDFPVFLHPETQQEYALARAERKQGVGYKGFAFDTAPSVTLKEDLARRDLTINAMAADAQGRIIDPFGGQRDLALGILRHVTDAFVEDPLRLLRVARFAARFAFEVAPETLALMKRIAASGELRTLPAERVWQELQRALGEPHPARFISVLRNCGALAVLLPEVERLFGVPQPAVHHPEIDTGAHLLLALTESARRAAPVRVRFAVLVHDLGKGVTPAEHLPGHPGHEERSAELAAGLCERLRVPNDHRQLAVLVARYHTKIHRALELRPATIVALLEALDAFRRPERFEEILLACEIDACGRAGRADADYPQAARLRVARQCVSEIDVAPLLAAGQRGPALKEAIRQARVARLKAAR